jgi:cytochrome c peroxidase
MRLQIIATSFLLVATAAAAQDLPPPITDDAYLAVNQQEAKLGQLLFYDPILSGNRKTSCADCHHPAFGTSDGVSLSFGDGGIGLGSTRRADPNNVPEERIPRNSPSLFNLGAQEFTVLFHDGRLEADPSRPSGIRTPMDADMVRGFASVLAAQTMFPVLSRDEMAGSYSENKVAALVRQGRITGAGGAWDVLARRVADLPEYSGAFTSVYPHITQPDDIAFTDIANAIAAFIAFEWRSDTAPFDGLLRGTAKLKDQQKVGLDLFYGRGQCAACHTGPFLTDHQFHAMAAPQIGPGKSATFEDHHRDEGRFRVTGRAQDRFAFRTPSLRNIALTAPYGHAGGHSDLSQFIADHADAKRSLTRFDRTEPALPAFDTNDFNVMDDLAQIKEIAAAVQADAVVLSVPEVQALVSFLDTLTDPISIKGRLGVPDKVPSGLPVLTVD